MNFIKLDISSVKSFILVAIQFICAGVIIFTGKNIPDSFPLILASLLFSLFGLWSMLIMKFHFNISPEVIKGNQLIKSGPYKYIRHPMYCALLGLILCFVLSDWSYFRFFMWIILLLDLIYKMNYEEKLLSMAFKDFVNYKKHTKKLIPFVY